MKQRTHKEFLKKLSKIHPKRKWKVLGTYEHNTIPLLLEDRYGKCLIKPNSLLQRSRPSVKTAIDKTSYTINKFKEMKDGHMFDYSEFIYDGARKKSTLICKAKGHKFLSDANNRLSGRGCPQCAKDAISDRVRSNTKEFVEKAIDKYGKKAYLFDKTDYVTATQEVIITCKKHGDFEQTPNRFLNGQVCPTCSYKSNTTNYYSLKKKTKKSIFYIIECWNTEEHFIKLGVTSRSISKRFRDSYDMPYNYKILREFEYANIDTSDAIEVKLLSFTKNAIYTPKISFSGRTETRLLSIKDPLLELFDVCADQLYYQAFINFGVAYDNIINMSILNSGDYSKLEIDSVMKGYEVHKKLNLLTLH